MSYIIDPKKSPPAPTSQPCVFHKMVGAALIWYSAISLTYAQDINEWTARKFLETAKYIVDSVDIEDDVTIARLLKIELQSRERPSPGKDLVLKSQQVAYLSKAEYRVSRPIEEQGGQRNAYLFLSLKTENLCVQLEDAHAVLGEDYEVPRPRQIDFWTSSGDVDGSAIANELDARDGRFDFISYNRPSVRQQGISIGFMFRRCAREIWISRRSPLVSK